MNKNLKRYLSPLIVVATLLIVWHLAILIFDYQNLAKGEGWGVVYVIGVLFWSCIMVGAGLLIKLIFKNKTMAIVVDGILLLGILISIVLVYT